MGKWAESGSGSCSFFMSHESLANVVIYTAIDLNTKLCAVSVLVHAFSVLVCYSIPFSTAPKCNRLGFGLASVKSVVYQPLTLIV